MIVFDSLSLLILPGKKDFTMGASKEKKSEDVRLQAFNSLPPAVRANLTDEEKKIFLDEKYWPESLCAKLSEFLYPLDPDTDCDEMPR